MSFEKYKNDKFYKAVADHLNIKYNSQSAFNQIKDYAKSKGVSGLDSQNDLNKIFGTGNYSKSSSSNNDPDKLDVQSNSLYSNKIKGINNKGKDKIKKFKKSATKSVVDQSVVNLDSQAAGGVRMRGIGGIRKSMLTGGIQSAFNRRGKRIQKIKKNLK